MAKMKYFGFKIFYDCIILFCFVNTCHSRESGNPGACKYLK